MTYLRTNIPLLFGLLFFLSFFPPVYGQQPDYSEDYLRHAKELQKQHDYLAAATLYQYVNEITNDSTIRAEALYRFKEVGDLAVSHINDLYGGIFEEIVKSRIDQLKKIGYNIKLVTMYETYYVNADTVTPQKLFKHYSGSKWAQKMHFDLITNEVNSYGESVRDDPESVIEKAETFINTYPNSKLKYETYLILGKAYTDIWNLYDLDKYLISEEFREQTSPDSARLKAIEFFTKSISDKSHDKSNLPYPTVVKALKNKESINVFFYHSD